MTWEIWCLHGGNQNSFFILCLVLFLFPPGVFLSPLRSQKAVPLPVWNDSCHNYSQVNTGRRRGWGRIEPGRRGKKKREARALWLLGGECVKNGNDSKWVSSSLPVPSLAKACAVTGVCTHARAQIEILKRTFTARGATPLTKWSGALLIRCYTWASPCDLRGPHVSSFTVRWCRRSQSLQLQTLWLGTRQAADNPAL